MGPAPAKPTLTALQELDEEAHWQASWALEHPLARPPPLEPAWELLLSMRRRWRHDIVRIRREVLAEVHLLIADLEDDSRPWMAARPSWVRATYSTPDKPAPTQVLAFLELLGYPDLAALTEDMTDGFQMLGEIRPGPGWRRRDDGKYQNPVPQRRLCAQEGAHGEGRRALREAPPRAYRREAPGTGHRANQTAGVATRSQGDSGRRPPRRRHHRRAAPRRRLPRRLFCGLPDRRERRA